MDHPMSSGISNEFVRTPGKPQSHNSPNLTPLLPGSNRYITCMHVLNINFYGNIRYFLLPLWQGISVIGVSLPGYINFAS